MIIKLNALPSMFHNGRWLGVGVPNLSYTPSFELDNYKNK